MASEELLGRPVTSADGENVGTVKEASGGYFKVDAPMERYYWLSAAHIESSAGRVITLRLRYDEVEGHELDAPGIEQAQRTGDAILSDEQALEQRERMERELAEQRQRLANQ